VTGGPRGTWQWLAGSGGRALARAFARLFRAAGAMCPARSGHCNAAMRPDFLDFARRPP